MRRLLKIAPPVPGESLRGLVADACARNCIPNTWGMLRHFGVVHRNRIDVSENEQIRYTELAATLGVPIFELETRCYPASPGWKRSFFGVEMMSAQIENRIRRFSPQAILEGHTYHPATHELRDLPFSLVGWDLLQDKCSCESKGLRQNWTRVNGTCRCNFCGASLSRITPIPVPQQLRSTLSVIGGLVEPDESARSIQLARLPKAIGNAPRTKLFSVLTKLAKVAGTHFTKNDGPAALQPVYNLARACDALLEWPHGLSHVATRSPEKDRRWSDLARNYLLLDQAHSDDCNPAGGGGTFPRSQYEVSLGKIGDAYVSTAEAARLTGVDEPALIEAWDSGLFTKHHSALGFQRVRAFSSQELIELAPKLRVMVARKQAANALGITVYGLEQLICLGAFRPAPPSPDRLQQASYKDEVDRFGTILAAMAGPVTSDSLPLSEAMRFISGRPHPWGPVLTSIYRGEIPFDFKPGKAALATKLMIPNDYLKKLDLHHFSRNDHIGFEFAERWDQADSLACLNMHRSANHLLAHLHVVGSRPKLYLASDIEKLARRGVATSDLGRRAGMSIAAVSRTLKKLHCEEIMPGLWEREAAESALLR